MKSIMLTLKKNLLLAIYTILLKYHLFYYFFNFLKVSD
jgi:hypothetical protein